MMIRILTTALFLTLLSQVTIWAGSFQASYMPPEIVYASDLRQRLILPPKININKADLNTLLTLPGMTENIALKLLRIRPLSGFQDLHQLPWLKPNQIDVLIQSLQNRVEF
jgi:DNA uptake protein ComE-like DNA-binding protein